MEIKHDAYKIELAAYYFSTEKTVAFTLTPQPARHGRTTTNGLSPQYYATVQAMTEAPYYKRTKYHTRVGITYLWR